MTDPEITQVDADQAASFLESWEPGPEMTVIKLARAFARHRMLGRAEGAAQERAEIVALIEASSGCHGFHTDNALYLIKLIEFDEYKRSE